MAIIPTSSPTLKLFRLPLRHFSISPQPKTNEPRKSSNVKSSTTTRKALSTSRLINTNPWSKDLETTLTASLPSVSKTLVSKTLHLIKAPTKALKFFNWVQEKDGSVHNDQNFLVVLESLGRSRNLNTARNFLFSIEKKTNGVVKLQDRFFNSLIRSYGKAGLFQESLKLFDTMKSMGVSPSVITFNGILSILLKKGRTNYAKEMYDEMLTTYGVAPDVYTYNILIRGFCLNSMVDEGFRFFKEMSRTKCEPDVITYNTLVDGLCRAGKVDIAHNVLKGMLKKGEELSPDLVTYTTLIRGYCMKQEIDEALDLFQEMLNREIKPNLITYNVLIQGLCEAGKLDEAKDILNKILCSAEFIPDTCTFNTLMNAHCSRGKLEEAMKVFEKMPEFKVLPDSASFSVLIRSLCKKQDFEGAEKLFDELSAKEILTRDDGCTPLVAAYNPMFEFLCGCGKTVKAETVFRQLMRRGIQDPQAFITLIMGHCREGNFEAGFELLVLMLRRDFVPDIKTYESLIDGLLLKKNPVLAFKTLEKMLNSSHRAQTSTVHSILSQLIERKSATEAASLIRMMLKKKIRQNANLSTDTILLLFMKGQTDVAYEIVELIYEEGFAIEMEKLLGFLYRRRKLLDAYDMLLFSMKRKHIFNADVYDKIIMGLCELHKLSEAFGLYHELVEIGIFENLTCLEDLSKALEAEGRVDEARFICKRLPGRRKQD